MSVLTGVIILSSPRLKPSSIQLPIPADFPVAWSCETQKDAGGSFTIRTSFNTSTLFWIDWGDGSSPEAHRVNTTNWIDFVHTYAQTGTYSVKIHACADYVQRLDLNNQQIRGLDLSSLGSIAYCNARKNNGITYFIPPDPGLRGNAHPFSYLDLDWNQLSQDSLDVSGFPLLQEIYMQGNRVPTILVNDLPALEKLQLSEHKKTLDCTLDLRASHEIKELILYGGGNPTGVGTEVKILLDSVPHLKLVRAEAAQIKDTLDLSSAASLEECNARKNYDLTFFIPPAPSLRVGTHPLNYLDLAWNVLAQDSLDLSGFASLRRINIQGNRLPSVLVQNLPALEILQLFEHKKTLNCTLDLRASNLLEELIIYGGANPTGVGTEVKVLLDSVPHLKNLSAESAQVTDTLDLSSAASLEQCNVRKNYDLTHFIPPVVSLRGSSHPLSTLDLSWNQLSQDSLDLSNFPLLEEIQLAGNRIPVILTQDLPALEVLQLSEHKRTLDCNLDLTASPLIRQIFLQSGSNPIGVGTEVRLQLDSIPHLQTLTATEANLVDTVNLSKAASLTTCTLNKNLLDAEATLHSLVQSGLTANPSGSRSVNVQNNLVPAQAATAASLTTRGWSVTY